MLRKGISDFLHRCALHEAVVNVVDYFRLRRLDFYPARVVSVIANGVPNSELVQSLLHSVADTFLDGDTFLLTLQFSQSRQDGDYQSVFAVTGVDTLRFKIDRHRRREVTQLTQRGQYIDNVSAEATDTLRENEVNFTRFRILDHLQKAFALIYRSAG